MIEVHPDGGNRFTVTIQEDDSQTQHNVTASRTDLERLGDGKPAEAVIDAAFRFLLDREAKESILRRFDLMVIARYFPEFEHELPKYLTT